MIALRDDALTGVAVILLGCGIGVLADGLVGSVVMLVLCALAFVIMIVSVIPCSDLGIIQNRHARLVVP